MLNLNSINTVFYHGSCADGVIAREVLKLHLQDSVEYVPFYFQELDTLPEKALFIDCSPVDSQIEDCLQRGCLIVDHHESYRRHYEALGGTYGAQMAFGENSKAESGAALAVKVLEGVCGRGYVRNLLAPDGEDVVRLISLGDTWRTTHTDFQLARKFSNFILLWGNAFAFDIRTLRQQLPIIEALAEIDRLKTESQVVSAIRTLHCGLKIAFINKPKISDAAEILRNQEGTDLVVGWSIRLDKERVQTTYSLRSQTFNCEAFAKAQGGGGHKSAAGCVFHEDVALWLDINPVQRFLDLLHTFMDAKQCRKN